MTSQVKSSQVKSSQVKSSQVKSSQVKSSQVKSSQVKSSQVRSGQVRSGHSLFDGKYHTAGHSGSGTQTCQEREEECVMTAAIRVLYVDDETSLLDLCKTYLERSGEFIVTTATSAPEALRILEFAKFDAIVSDYQMPEMDGIEFLKVVRGRGDKTPFIIFTGKGREEVMIEALNAGADFYLQKGGEPKSQFVELGHKIRRGVQHQIDEKALHAQTNLLISMINSSSEFVIFSVDRKYQYLAFNEKHRKEMQRVWKADIRIGMNILDCMTDPALRKGAQESIDRALRGEAFTEIQHQPDPDIWYEFNWNPIRQRTGDVMGVSVFIRDITERQLTDEKIKTSEMRYRRLFESAKDGILILNQDTGEIIDANPFIENLLRYSPRELIGKHLWDIGLFKDQLTSKIAFEELQAKKYIRYEDLPLETKDGQRIDVEFISNIYPINNTSVVQCIIRDITERKQAADMLALTSRKLTLMNDVTYQYIQNKVTALRGYVELSKEAKTDADRVPYIDKEEHILADIHQLIKNSKEYQAMGLIQRRWIPVEQSIRIAVSLVSPGQGISVETALPGLELYTDPLIEKIFANLIENAVLHGKTTRRIRFSCEEKPDGLILVCEDDGVGIVPEVKAHIFDRGFSGNDRFGLFFISECIALFGMTIAETGEPGKGARFEITVPKGMYRFMVVR